MEKILVWPDVKNYVQVYHYLQDVYWFRKKKEPGFSYESWAKELGISSRSHLRLSIIGRRNISDSMAQTFIANLGLTHKDKDYFLLLLLYSQSGSSSQKSYYAKKLADFVKVKAEKQIVVPTLRLLQDPAVIALRLLLTFEDVSGSETELSQQLNAPLGELKEKLQILSSHGLVQEEAPGRWRATSKWIQFQDQADHSGIRAYHTASLESAKASMQFPVDSRYFRSLTWALNAEEYKSFLSDFSDFIEQMNVKYDKNILEDRKLMQLNINLIPALLFNAKDSDPSEAMP